MHAYNVWVALLTTPSCLSHALTMDGWRLPPPCPKRKQTQEELAAASFLGDDDADADDDDVEADPKQLFGGNPNDDIEADDDVRALFGAVEECG